MQTESAPLKVHEATHCLPIQNICLHSQPLAYSAALMFSDTAVMKCLAVAANPASMLANPVALGFSFHPGVVQQ